jgi:hypothetical protein
MLWMRRSTAEKLAAFSCQMLGPRFSRWRLNLAPLCRAYQPAAHEAGERGPQVGHRIRERQKTD